MIGEVGDPGFTSAEIEVDSIIFIHLKRVTNGGTNNTNDIFVLMSDIHYISHGKPTKNKSPNFYT
jgi:hypothetical protein